MIYQIEVETTLGKIFIRGSEHALTYVGWQSPKIGEVSNKEIPLLLEAKDQLQQYLAGTRKNFNLPYDLSGGSEFQQIIWRELLKIPYGSTISYSELATRVGSPRAARAVGSANGRNPICLFIPCHRVITSSGLIGGYIAGNEIKTRLLELEQQNFRVKTSATLHFSSKEVSSKGTL